MPNVNEVKEANGETPIDIPCLQKLDSPTGSPTKGTPLPERAELEGCVSNLSLAHEIVMNQDFCFRQTSPPKDSLEGRVTEVVHRAFWDVLQEQLSSCPPNYSHAVTLLQEVKATLLSLLLPGHARLRAQLDEVLDLPLIQQQAHHGALDLPRLAAYVTSTMGSLCAPVRDPDIRALQGLSDPVDILRDILRVLGLMKTDMVNFTVQNLRPHLLQQAVQYERTKFQQILDKEPASLDRTTAWLRGAAQEFVSKPSSGPEGVPPPPDGAPGSVSPTAVLNRACLNLLRWDPQDHNYPETVVMDRVRLDSLGRSLNLLVLEAAVLLLTTTHCGGTVSSQHGFVGKLKKTITALLEGSHSRSCDLQGALQGLAEQVLVQVRSVQEGSVQEGSVQEGPLLDRDGLELLKRQISDLGKADNPVRKLIGERVWGYLQATLEAGSQQGAPAPPPALRLVGAELTSLASSFWRILHFNRSVFGPFYAPILRKVLFPEREAEMGEDSR
ncbi:T-complex protein 11-like protein 1 isoform X2 [Hypomesus transpacificus]|uniref:T-complex protein 11-like protein 1 isoform X2 n=1 Tax=Hypomesus transpacificus TaxID=137520 RepID=UPI001F074BE1|nr:T-complex protein 11-like protein 1 isoform X2 [Hypomesus transpacificus]